MLTITLLLLIAITLGSASIAAFVPLPVEWGLPTAAQSESAHHHSAHPHYYMEVAR